MPTMPAHCRASPARRATAAGSGTPGRERIRGISLIEVVMFIVIVGVALAAITPVFVQATASSVDPAIKRQALAIAESVMDEVLLMSNTFCDSDDDNAETATSSAACATLAETMGPESGETRYTTPQFDNVNDYNGFSMTGIKDITNTAMTGLSSYSVSVAVASAALGSITAGSGDALRVTVTVTGPSNTTVVLDGYRSRHAPNAP
ncbi:type IV pilus modification PilV family protein [Aquabacterium sp.]|uniref:type IV pilus modification PilV family protein n=1 Tax=Aquabacterium sp. TaxID=1872578 RepID=UPI003D6C7F36